MSVLELLHSPVLFELFNVHTKNYKLEPTSSIPAKYKKNVNIINNEIKILRDSDAIYSLEIYADFIDKIELVIGVFTINIFYNIKNDDKLWRIEFKELSNNCDFIPLILLPYNDIKFKIYGENIESCFVEHALFGDDDRRFLVQKNSFDFLINQQIRYNIKLNGNKIFINLPEDNRLSTNNLIISLRFKFEKDYDIKTINVYAHGNLLTTLTKSNFTKVSETELIIKDFYYKLFLYNNIFLEFDQNISDNVILTTTNFNILRIQNNEFGLRYEYLNLHRIINNSFELEIEEISEKLYQEKVLPKNDKICSISHEEFKENERRVICGTCFTSYMEDAIKEWLKFKKFCPYRCDKNIWYVKNFN